MDQSYLNGLNGIPFRLRNGETVPNLKEDDPQYVRPVLVADAKVKVFNMGVPGDIAEYADIWNRAANGKSVISAEERHWSDKEQTFLIFLRWGDLFFEMPKGGPHGDQVSR